MLIFSEKDAIWMEVDETVNLLLIAVKNYAINEKKVLLVAKINNEICMNCVTCLPIIISLL